MSSRPAALAAALAVLLPVACSGGSSPGDDRRFVPEGLPNTNVDGQDTGLTLVAFTLVQATSGTALYAAVKNKGDAPSCQPGMITEFYDRAGQHLTSAGSIVQTDRFYRLDDGTVISCIDPGETSMTGVTGLPDAVVIDQLGSLQHLFPAFTVPGIVPVAGLAVTEVQRVTDSTGFAYAGTLANQLDVMASAARVTVFPVNRVGRPLGMATSSTTADLPAGATSRFETSRVDDPGVAAVAFPSASLSP